MISNALEPSGWEGLPLPIHISSCERRFVMCRSRWAMGVWHSWTGSPCRFKFRWGASPGAEEANLVLHESVCFVKAQ